MDRMSNELAAAWPFPTTAKRAESDEWTGCGIGECDVCDESAQDADTGPLTGCDVCGDGEACPNVTEDPNGALALLDAMLATDAAATVERALPTLSEPFPVRQLVREFLRGDVGDTVELALDGMPAPHLAAAIRTVLVQRAAFAAGLRAAVDATTKARAERDALKHLRPTNSMLAAENKDLASRLCERSNELEGVRSMLAGVSATCDAYARAHNERADELANAREHVATLKRWGDALAAECAELTELFGACNASNLELTERNAALAARVGELELERDDARAELADVRLDLETAEEERAALAAELVSGDVSRVTVIRFASGHEMELDGDVTMAGVVRAIGILSGAAA